MLYAEQSVWVYNSFLPDASKISTKKFRIFNIRDVNIGQLKKGVITKVHEDQEQFN